MHSIVLGRNKNWFFEKNAAVISVLNLLQVRKRL